MAAEEKRTPAQELEATLTRELGPLLGGSALTKALGYRTQSAFRQALSAGRLSLPVFEIEGRRGKFALTREVAAWLTSQCGHSPATQWTQSD